VLSGESTNTNFIVIGLTRSGFEPTIYRTRDEHTNYYTGLMEVPGSPVKDLWSSCSKDLLDFSNPLTLRVPGDGYYRKVPT
jgi:hypothetical protein